MASAAEQLYTLQGVADELREDGRGLLDFRHISLEMGLFPQAGGSARIQMGGIDALIAVTPELAETLPDSPDMGQIVVSIGAVETVASEDTALWLEEALNPLYSRNSIPDALRSLCILRGEQCWKLRVHAQLLTCDGSPLDTLAIGVAAALRGTRVPRVSAANASADADSSMSKSAKSGHVLDLDESLDESLPFDCSGLPLYITLASIGNHAVADCTAKERLAASSSVSVAICPDGRISAIRGGGGFGLHLQHAGEMVQCASNLCAELLPLASAAISRAQQKFEAQRWPHGEGAAIGLLA